MIEDTMRTVKKIKRKSDRFEILLAIAKILVSPGRLSERIEVAERIADMVTKSKNEHYHWETVQLFSLILKESFIAKKIRI